MSTAGFQTGSVVLAGYGMVSIWRRPDAGNPRWLPLVHIMQASSMDEGAYSPAQDIAINGRDALIALRSAIDEALGEATKGGA